MAPHDAMQAHAAESVVGRGRMSGISSAGGGGSSLEFVAVILAATAGARLFPLTSDADDDDDDVGDGGSSAGGAEIEVNGDDEEFQVLAGDTTVEEGDSGRGVGDTDVRAGPKHLLPITGVPLICRLVGATRDVGFEECHVAIAKGDDLTVSALEGMKECERTEEGVLRLGGMTVRVVRLDVDCAGSANALRSVLSSGHLSRDSHVVVMPGDLYLGGGGSELRLLCDAHRRGCSSRRTTCPPTSLTMLLADVGDEDEATGLPLKESSKAKKGGLARDEEDIEFIGLSPLPLPAASHHPSRPQRVMLKQSKIAVEEDEDLTGSTPKLILPKGRVRRSCLGGGGNRGGLTVRTDLLDLHVYILSPWTIALLRARPDLVGLQRDLVPLLVARQVRGVGAAFGSRVLASEERAGVLREALAGPPFFVPIEKDSGDGEGTAAAPAGREGSGTGVGLGGRAAVQAAAQSYSVAAQVLRRDESRLALRACTVGSYLYGCREAIAAAVRPGNGPGTSDIRGSGGKQKGATLMIPSVLPLLPEGTTPQAKSGSALLPGSSVGDKVRVQSTTVGRKSKLGNRCRLNNVVVMDNVTVGENCILQNSILGFGCVVGDNCNLNDCQVSPGGRVPAGTKEKGETFMK